MPNIKLSSDQLGLISIFQNMSGATVRDCIVDDKGGRLIFIISKGQMGLAIGK
ncbi:MAG: KH domain-containing protein, partial [Nitrososphaerales archaeon]